MRWKRQPSGQLRFFGTDAMREIRSLIDGDDDYTWSCSPWPHREWIDVFPRNVEAQNTLLVIVGDSEVSPCR